MKDSFTPTQSPEISLVALALARLTSGRAVQFTGHVLVMLALVFAVCAGAQSPPQGLHAPLVWDPSSPLPKSIDPSLPSVLTPALSPTAWTALGPAPISNGQRPGSGPVSGRVTGIAADPTNANIIYVAAAGGGAWKTTDGGANWTPLTDNQTTLSMGAIVIAPSNHLVVYAGTGEANNSGDSNFGRGILKSTDGGATWALQTGPAGVFNRLTVSRIAVDPTNASIAYAVMADFGSAGLCCGNSGVWKTTDGGTTWANTTTAIFSLYGWSDVAIDLTTPTTLYAALGYYGGVAQNGVYKSTNSGGTWTLLAAAPNGTANGRISVAVSKSNSQVVYVTTQSSSTSGLGTIARSDNGGTTWTNLTAGTPNYMGGQGWYDQTVIVDPSNSAIVYVAGAAGANSVLRSTNSGVSWTDISSGTGGQGPHADHHASDFDTNGKYLDGDDGGIYRYDPVTNVWTQLNGTTTYLNTIQFEGLGLHPTNPSVLLAGSQDNGEEMYTGTLSWTVVEGGDGGPVKFSKTNPSRVYHTAPVASFGSSAFFRRSDDGGTTWTSQVTGITDTASNTQLFYTPFAVDPGNGDHVLFGATHLWETTNGGASWTALGAAFANPIAAIGLAPSDPNTIYVSTNGNFWMTTNHGTTWTQHNLPVAGTIQDLLVFPTTPQSVMAVINGFTTGGNVFGSPDGGVTWFNDTSNLPNEPVWSIQMDAAVIGGFYVGADDGVYKTTSGGASWTRFGTGLPNVQVYQIEYNPTLGILGAATHGRGVWEISTAAVTTVTNVTSTTANGTYGTGVVIPVQVTFSATVTVTGTPQLALNSGGTASYVSGSGTSTLTFNYTVLAGQNSAKLDYTATTALTLNGGTIHDAFTNNAILALAAPGAAGSLGANKNLVINTSVGGTPSVVSLSPVNSTGNATFAMTVGDTAGNADIGLAYLLFNNSLTPHYGCLVLYDNTNNFLLLYNDAGTGLVAGTITPGTAGTLSNTRCQISGTGASVVKSGNNLTVNVPITFSGAFVGTNTQYIYVVTKGNVTAGYVPEGNWTGNADATPTIPAGQFSAASSPSTFLLTYSEATSGENIALAYAFFGENLVLNNSCVIAYSAGVNLIYLLNDAGTGLAGSITPGAAGTAVNSQCTISSGGVTSVTGANLVVPVTITASASFGGLKTAWGYALNSVGTPTAGFPQIGAWMVSTNVQPGTITMPAPTGSGNGPYTLQVTYSDANGYLDLEDTTLLVTGNGQAANACGVVYAPAYNAAFLLNDAGTGYVAGSITPGVVGAPLSNTHCTLQSAGAPSNNGTTTLTLPLQLTFSSFTGVKTIYGQAFDAGGAISTFQTLGMVTLP